MSTSDHEPARPADEAGTPREPTSYAVTLAAIEAALAEPLPPAGEVDATLAMGPDIGLAGRSQWV